jgi:hypothetical protein
MSETYDGPTMYAEWRALCARREDVPVPPPWYELPTHPINIQDVWHNAARIRTETKRRERAFFAKPG